MIELDPFESLALTLHHSRGTIALLLGSGISRSAGVPTGWEITLDLIKKVARLRGVETQQDWGAWYRKEFGKEPSYSEILDSLGSTPSERRAILHQYIESPSDEEPREPTAAHRAIAKLVARKDLRVIITTNFDRLLENALREVGVEPTVIANEDALKGATPLVHADCTVVKIHGDYLDARILNTQDELKSYPKRVDGLLDRVFDEYGLLVVGWSGEWDTALRNALLRAPNRRYPLYWASRGQTNNLGQDIVDARAGRIIKIDDANTFFVKLANSVDALDAERRRHPESLALTLALAKRYCRDDSYGLEWSNLLANELERVREYVHGPDWPTESPTKQNISAHVAAVVARTEALRRICMIGERWGTTNAKLTVERVLPALNFNSQPIGGFDWWTDTRNLPAAICFEWALAGAIYNNDYTAAGRIMQLPVRNSNRGEVQPAIIQYHMCLLGGNLDWKVLEGFERLKLPHSGYLEAVFNRDAPDIVIDESAILPLFDRTEFLMSMQIAHHRALEDRAWFWVPLGQFIFRSRESFQTQLAELAALNADSPLLKAGLLGGTPATAKSAAEAVQEFIKKHGSSLWW